MKHLRNFLAAYDAAFTEQLVRWRYLVLALLILLLAVDYDRPAPPVLIGSTVWTNGVPDWAR